jgi:hypothetical protein
VEREVCGSAVAASPQRDLLPRRSLHPNDRDDHGRFFWAGKEHVHLGVALDQRGWRIRAAVVGIGGAPHCGATHTVSDTFTVCTAKERTTHAIEHALRRLCIDARRMRRNRVAAHALFDQSRKQKANGSRRVRGYVIEGLKG